MVLRASGNSILYNIVHLLRPKAFAALINLYSTCRNPVLVNRITRAIKKIIIAITPAVIPILNSITTLFTNSDCRIVRFAMIVIAPQKVLC